jgi:hypothetical protein
MTSATTPQKTSAAGADSVVLTPAPAAAPVPATALNGFSITALVLGITGIALGQGLLSIGAIVFGFVARSKEPQARLMANWGLVLGFIGTFGGFVLAIWGIAAFAPFALWAGALDLYF